MSEAEPEHKIGGEILEAGFAFDYPKVIWDTMSELDTILEQRLSSFSSEMNGNRKLLLE